MLWKSFRRIFFFTFLMCEILFNVNDFQRSERESNPWLPSFKLSVLLTEPFVVHGCNINQDTFKNESGYYYISFWKPNSYLWCHCCIVFTFLWVFSSFFFCLYEKLRWFIIFRRYFSNHFVNFFAINA